MEFGKEDALCERLWHYSLIILLSTGCFVARHSIIVLIVYTKEPWGLYIEIKKRCYRGTIRKRQFVIVHHKNPQLLATKIFKVKIDPAPDVMK